MARTITLTFEDGSTHQYQNAPDDITPDAVMSRASQEFNGKRIVNIDGGRNAEQPASEQPQAPLLNRLGRQAGLTARAGIEGAADIAGLFADPVAASLSAVGVPNQMRTSDLGRSFSDAIGLPSASNPTERIVQDASKLLGGTGGFIKGAQMGAKVGPQAVRKVSEFIAQRPGIQAASAIGAGFGGGGVRELGGGPVEQLFGAVAGSVAVPMIANTVQSGVRNIAGMMAPAASADDVIAQSGIVLEDIPANVRDTLRADVQKAMQEGGDLSGDAIRRLADYRAVGATPMRSNLTLSPADVTREQNLMKLSANSQDPAVQALANNRNQNNAVILQQLNDAGAGQADDAVVAGRNIIGALDARDKAAKSTIDKLYTQARNTEGRSALLDNTAFTNNANDLLDEKLLGGKLPSDVRNLLNKVAQGEMPLTVDVAEQFKTRIGALQRASRDGAEQMALSQVRQALDEAPLMQGQGQAAINAFNKARRANRAYMQVVESTPALKAVRDGIEPDKFVDKFVTGSSANIRDLENLRRAVKKSPEALDAVKSQMMDYLKNQATGGAADEVAKVSQANFNKALKKIGDGKLSIFFTKDEIQNLKTLGRVASYEQFQPSGSAVNNSNTAAAGFSYLLERIGDNALIRKIPLGAEIVGNPAKSIAGAVGARNAMNVTKALSKPRPKLKAPMPYAAIPAVAASSGE